MKLQDYAKNRRVEQVLRYSPKLRQTFVDWLVKYSNYNVDRKRTNHIFTKEVFDIYNDESYEKCVIEYISGMTDQYAIAIFEEIVMF